MVKMAGPEEVERLKQEIIRLTQVSSSLVKTIVKELIIFKDFIMVMVTSW